MHITLLQINVAVCKGIGQKEYITSGFCQSKKKNINQKTKNNANQAEFLEVSWTKQWQIKMII